MKLTIRISGLLFLLLVTILLSSYVKGQSDDPDGGILLDELIAPQPTPCPGLCPQRPASAPSDQQKGSILIYNLYASSASNPGAENTRINITNTTDESAIAVHLFFIDGATCSVADNYICLTTNQTMSFLTSDIDPGVRGYLIAVAVGQEGLPARFNALIGDEYVKLATGFHSNLGAVAFRDFGVGGSVRGPQIRTISSGLSFGPQFGQTSLPARDALPRVLAIDSIPSKADGFETLLVINRIGGSLLSSADPIGNLFGLIFDDQEQPYSFTHNANSCQLVMSLSDSFPRTTPRLNNIIPAGRTGWAKFWSTNIDGVLDLTSIPGGGRYEISRGLLGAALYKNSVTGFSSGHNLHALTLALIPNTDVLEMPIFPPNCD